MNRTRLYFIALTLIVSAPRALTTNTEDQLRKSYVNTEQLLRHSYASDGLKFDGNGNPKNHEQEGPWTVLSGVVIDDLLLKSGKLELRGHRRLIVFDDQNKKMRSIKLKETFSIEVQASDGPDQEARLSAALAQVFVAPEDLASVVPDYWRDYIARATGKPAQGAPCEDSNVREVEPGTVGEKTSSGVSEGRKIHDIMPIYSAIARQSRVQGELALMAVIDKGGNVSRVCITQALGAGLDDNMVDTVRQWKYSPYKLDGQPVEIQTTIKTHFGFR
jgi:TonB family protein